MGTILFVLIKVATVPTVYGIETSGPAITIVLPLRQVATVPTVYGIETMNCRELILS